MTVKESGFLAILLVNIFYNDSFADNLLEVHIGTICVTAQKGQKKSMKKSIFGTDGSADTGSCPSNGMTENGNRLALAEGFKLIHPGHRGSLSHRLNDGRAGGKFIFGETIIRTRKGGICLDIAQTHSPKQDK